MSHISAFAISTFTSPLRGIHLLWNGPSQFLFAPGGWRIERKVSGPSHLPQQPVCDELGQPLLNVLRDRLELKVAHGWLRLTPGQWTGPDPGPCEVFTLDFDTPSTGVTGLYRGLHGLAIGLYRGKAVRFQLLLSAPRGQPFDFDDALVDEVIVYGLRTGGLRFCVSPPPVWRGGAEIARMQVPLKEFDPGLGSAQDELAAAEGRLVDGEAIDSGRFSDLADLLRVALSGPGRQPVDNLLRIATSTDDPEEMFALDPLRALVVSPKWRRVMGLSFIDRDPALIEGEHYDYRITGMFPKSEIGARVFGFHTIPPGTLLPQDFLVDGCRFRLPAPLTVQAAPGIAQSGNQWVTRLGIPLAPRNAMPWAGPGIGDFCLSVDLPEPVSAITLELDEGHHLEFVAGEPGGPMTAPERVPPGSRPFLNFPAPASRVNFSGKGFLFALRIDGDESADLAELSTLLRGVQFTETPLPEMPAQVTARNLQTGDGPVLSPEPNQIRDLHVPGIRVAWRPAPAADAPIWPPDLTVPPPIDAAIFEAERRVGQDQPFGPVLTGEDNLMFGARGEQADTPALRLGSDLMEAYPELPQSRGIGGDLSYADTFRAPDDANPARRDAPPPGTILRYRVRTLDAIGRPSAAWRESGNVRLERHEPPPAPAAYDPRPADELASPGFTGVYAKVLVTGSPELDAEEAAILGTSDNAILLRWGWHAAQRAQDPFASGFRVYLSRTYDVLPAEIQAVSPVAAVPGDFQLTLEVTGTVTANAARGLSISAGYPFFIVEHTGGSQITMLVRTRVPGPDGNFRMPQEGPVSLPLRLSPQMNRPRSWEERLVFPSGETQLPITAETRYQAVIRDRLLLSEEHPRDSLWVGVSSADSESYVDDTFPLPGSGGALPGNESRIVAIRCDAKRALRPGFSPPPPAGPVPRLVTGEPVAGVAVRHTLDLVPHVAAPGLAPGSMVQPERACVSDLFGTLRVSGGQLMARAADARGAPQPPQAVTLPNPDDQALVVSAVQNGASEELQDRLAVRLAADHPYAHTLFTSATASPVPFGPFDETLPSDEARYLYRLRRADSMSRLSAGAAIANVIVRVPSQAPGATPRRLPPQDGDPPQRLRLRVPADPRLTHVLVFRRVAAAGATTRGELLRLANRNDVDAAETIRLRLSDGTVLAPAATALANAARDDEGWLVSLDLDDAGAGEAVDVWASTLTADRIPSPAGGPWRILLPRAQLSPPMLTVSASARTLDFSWTLPDPLITRSWLERSTDGDVWERASRVLRKPGAAATVSAEGAQRSYRVVAASQDGRRAESNSVEV